MGLSFSVQTLDVCRIRTTSRLVHEEDEGSEEEDDKKLFSSDLASIRLDLLPGYAWAVWRNIDRDNDDARRDKVESISIGSPIFGSYHVLFPVKFGNGTRWPLKVTANGTRDQFDQSAARALRSEALVMQLLRRETTIPLPEVFAFNTTCNHDLNCPFILIDFVSGKSLYHCWFDKTSPKEIAGKEPLCTAAI
jgi:hypothetical protein